MARWILPIAAVLCMASGAPIAWAQSPNIAPAVCVKPPDGKSPPPRTTTTSTTAPGVHVNVTCEAPKPLPVAEGPKAPPQDPNPPTPPTPPNPPKPPVKPPGESSPPATGNPPEKPPGQPLANSNAKTQEWGVREGVMLATTLAALALLLVGAWVAIAALDLLPGKTDDSDVSTDPLRQFSGMPLRAPAMFTFRRHWGSFGGESTGWNMSPNLMRLLMGLALMAVGVWLLLSAIDGTARSAKESATADTTVKPAPKTGADAK